MKTIREIKPLINAYEYNPLTKRLVLDAKNFKKILKRLKIGV